MSLLYSNPLNYRHKTQNFMIRFVMVWGWILGMFPFQYSQRRGIYVMGPKFLNIIKALALPFNIVTSIFSVYGFCTNIAGRFVDTKIDIILNFIIVVQFFTSVCAINLVFYSKTTKILNLLNQVIYLKKLVLRLNDNPFLDNKVVGFFLRRWAASTVIIIYLSIISAEAQITMPIARIYIFLAISGFSITTFGL